MSQGLRDMMSNRRFAIPLIALLAVCLFGLLMLVVVLVLRPGANGEPVAQATETPTEEVTPTVTPTVTPSPTATSTPRPSPTLVPVGTPVDSAGGDATPAETPSDGTPVESATETPSGGTPVESATETPSGGTPVESATEAPTSAVPEEDELAQTGVGWGLFLVAGVGLAVLVLAARRLRLVGK